MGMRVSYFLHQISVKINAAEHNMKRRMQADDNAIISSIFYLNPDFSPALVMDSLRAYWLVISAAFFFF